MINSKLKKLIEENPVALGTVNKNNTPNVIAVAYVKVVSKNQIVITDNFMRQTRDNLLKNNNVCLAVWNKDWEGIKLIGKAKYYTTGKWNKYVNDMKENKGFAAKGAVVVTIAKKIKMG